MIDEKSYPQFHTLFGAYLNQDADLWGETLEEVVSCFTRDSSFEEIQQTLAEIEKIKKEAGGELDKIFYDAYGFDFNPILWGYTTFQFFEKLKELLKNG